LLWWRRRLMASSVRAREANRSVGSPGQARLGARGGVRGSWEGLRGLLASGRLARLDGGTKNAASWRRQGSREFPPNRLAPPRVSQIRFARGPICVSPAFRPVAAWGGGTAWAGDTARRDVRAGISVGDLLELLSFEAAAEAAASLTLPLWEEVPVGGRNGCKYCTRVWCTTHVRSATQRSQMDGWIDLRVCIRARADADAGMLPSSSSPGAWMDGA